MDAGSCLSEPGAYRFGFIRRSGVLFEPQRKPQQQQQQPQQDHQKSPNIIRSPSVAGTEVSTKSGNNNPPRMAHLETLEAKMANIEVSLCNSAPRRRKSSGSVISGSASVRSTPIPRSETSPAKEMRSALQDREAVIQNLRVQLGLGKLPRPSGTPLDDSERPAAEQRLHRLKVDAENKRIAIRNLKMALDKLDITDNIDVRIRQAELEYALGREELQLLSLVEEAQALQSRFDKAKVDTGTIFSTLQSGNNLALVAITSNVGRWAATTKPDGNGLWIEWALEGEGLYRGDRLLEANGVLLCATTRDELQRILGTSGKCQLVVLRRKVNNAQHQQLMQSQEDNMRLQHRISYLEEQVKEMQESREATQNMPTAAAPAELLQKSPHVTSINITSPPVTPPDKPEVYQRGNFIMTIVGGKPVKKATPLPISSSSASSASSASSISSQRLTNGSGGGESVSGGGTKAATAEQKPEQRQQELRGIYQRNSVHPQQQQQHKQHLGLMTPTSGGHSNGHHHQMHNVSRSISASSISINSDVTQMQRRERERERKERERELRREIRDRFIYKSRSGSRLDNGSASTPHNNGLSYSKSGEQLHLTSAVADKRREMLIEMSRRNAAHTINELSRSVKSLDFDSDYGGGCATEPRKSRHSRNEALDYTSDSMGKHMRPMPPKKPLRLSLQRAQSLQTVDGNLTDIESRKKGMKRTYRGDRPPPDVVQFVDSGSREILNGSASLGRMKYV